MKKTFLFLAALAMSAMMWAETASVDLCTSWDKTLGYTTNYTQDYTIDDLNGGETTMTLAVKGVYRQKATETSFQMNKKEGYFKNTTALPGKITKIETTWSAAKGPTKCYFATDAEASASDAVVEVSSATSVTYTPNDDQEYYYFNIDVKTGSGSAQMISCVVYYEPGTPSTVTLDSLVIKGKAEKMEYEVGEAFDHAGLEVWGIYTKTVKHDSTSQITKGITWSIDPETFAEISDNASVTLSASYKDLTSADTTITGINVKAAVVKMDVAFDFTTNLYGHKGVSSSGVTDGDIVVGEKFNEDPAQIKFTQDGSTQTRFWDASSKHELRLYNGATFVLSIVGDYKIIKVEFTGSAVNLEGNGVTVSNKVWEGDAAKSVTFVNTATTSKINSIKVTYIAAAPAAANPTITPDTVANVYWEPITVTLACETEGASIYYTTDGSEPTASATKYTAPFSVTATTTVKAIAIKSGLDNSEVVSETFTFGTVFASLKELVEKQPAKDDVAYVQVTITNAEIDSFYVSSKGYTNGVFVTAANTAVELYTNDVPETWEAGGKISGTIKAQWNLYKGTPQLQKWDGGWEAFTYAAPVSEADLVSITLSIDKDTLYQNTEFKYNGTVMANYSDETTKDVTKTATFTGYDMTTLGDQVVTVSYTEGEITKEAQYALTVVEKVLPSEYAAIYTSNVEFTDEGGTKATLSQVVVAEGDTVDAIKCGTGSVDGSCVITIPAATKTLHFHAVAWTGKPTTMDVNGTIYNLVADAGISGTGTIYTLAGDPSDYYFSFDPKGATAITFTAKSDHRFVLFGVNAELPEGIVAAPKFEPAATDFDQEVMVTLTCETEGAEIFYALNEEVTSMNAIKYTEPIKLIETTTIYAVAKKDGKESEQASKTYTLIPVFESLEALVTNLPATDTKVKVKVTLTDVAIDSFYVSGKYTNGVYVSANGAALELYKYDVPATWEVGGTISGTIIADWNLYKGVPELQNFDSWDAYTYTEPSPIPEEITENFTPDLTKAVGLNEQTTAAVNEGVLTVIAASEPWAAAGVKIPFDGYVKTTNFAGIKASAKVPTGGIEVCAYVIDQDGKRWYQESMNSTTYADWASFAHTTVPFVTLWDGGTAEDWANAELVAFGFYGASGDGLVDFEINLKDVEILVGEQPIEALNYISARKKAAKQLIKGQIMIIREGKVYNMLGF